jgi:DNA-binding transcriptional MocR family regulator
MQYSCVMASQAIYAELAEELALMVQSGQLRAGDRLPSVRRLVEQKRVSATTAVAALRALERRGLAYARPQSGYFAKAPLRAAEPVASTPSVAVKKVGIDDVLIRVIDASRDPAIAPLGAATADESLFPVGRMQRLLASVSRRQPHLFSRYALDYAGSDALRRQLQKRYADIGCKIGAQEILITNGCTEALNLALRAVARPGDAIAVESPVYYCILQSLQDQGIKALEIASHPRSGLQVNALAAALEGPAGHKIKACMVSANFSNPTGACMPDGEKRRLVELCDERGIVLIEDDIYGDLQHAGPRPLPAKAFDRSGNVLLCSSFSKTLAPGARIGWLCGGRLAESLKLRKFASTGASSLLQQEVIAELLESGGYERHLQKLRQTFARQVDEMAILVTRHFPPGTKLTQPSGGFVMWVELPGKIDSLELFDAAVKRGVNFAPGSLFSATGGYRNFLRLNCGRVAAPNVEGAVATLGRLARRLLGSPLSTGTPVRRRV